MTVSLHLGDCLDVMPTLPDNSIDAVITDPPYGLTFMGKDWDRGIPGVHFWQEALRVAKPGAFLLAFGGTRTFHRLACAIEDAGWEIRDTIMWVHAQGFPKSHDVSKAIDKAAGAERELMALSPSTVCPDFPNPCQGHPFANGSLGGGVMRHSLPTVPATDAARQWAGWGTALKPAWEPIIVARKPLQGTVAANVLTWGTGAINVDGCRISTTDGLNGGAYAKNGSERTDEWGKHNGFRRNQKLEFLQPAGRWPANLVHDGSDEVMGLFPVTTQNGHRVNPSTNKTTWYGVQDGSHTEGERGYDDTGSAARFFYTAKASRADRDEGCEGLELRGNGGALNVSQHGDTRIGKMRSDGAIQHAGPVSQRNHHPTVKPTSLMRWLVRLVTPPGGVVLDPFCGSGSTGKACVLEGFRFIGIELNAEYLDIAQRRIGSAQPALVMEES